MTEVAETPMVSRADMLVACCPSCGTWLVLLTDDTATALFCVRCKTVAAVYKGGEGE